jgi:hypothetical protein
VILIHIIWFLSCFMICLQLHRIVFFIIINACFPYNWLPLKQHVPQCKWNYHHIWRHIYIIWKRCRLKEQRCEIVCNDEQLWNCIRKLYVERSITNEFELVKPVYYTQRPIKRSDRKTFKSDNRKKPSLITIYIIYI